MFVTAVSTWRCLCVSMQSSENIQNVITLQWKYWLGFNFKKVYHCYVHVIRFAKNNTYEFWTETLNFYQCAKFQSATSSKVSIHGAHLTCCRNLRNRFQCECATGYEGAMCEIDKDECASNPCLNQGVCKDLPNGFECRCLTGFTGDKFQILLSIYVWNISKNLTLGFHSFPFVFHSLIMEMF